MNFDKFLIGVAIFAIALGVIDLVLSKTWWKK